MSKCYVLGLLLGLCKRASEGSEMLGGATLSSIQDSALPRRPKQPEKFLKAPRRITSRKRRRFVRQRKLPKSLLSA